jgi:hypothetical protein
MPHIRTNNQPVPQITVIEPEPGKQAEALSLMTERARFMGRQPGLSPSAYIAASTDAAWSTTSNGRVRDLLQSAHKSLEFRKGSVRSVGGRDLSPLSTR